MKTYNPTPLRVGWFAGKFPPPHWTATFILKGTFHLRPGAPLEWAEEPLHLSGDLHVEDDPARPLLYASDFAPFKPRADILVRATAHAPGGQPLPSFPVSLSVGRWSKSLTVHGPRRWKRGLTRGVSEATPIATLPLTYEHALGGSGFARNPLGCGWKSDDAPQIESPAQPLRGPSDSTEPAGLAPIPRAWPQRMELAGTYDEKWLRTRWPWFPENFDWGYFNAAPRDQQIDGYLAGNEELTFQNLHPDQPRWSVRLPGVRPRCFAGDRIESGVERFREVPLKLDTLWVDLQDGILVLVWRGQLPVRTFKLKELERVVIVTEDMADPPQPIDQYQHAIAEAEAETPEPVLPDRSEERDAPFRAMDEQRAAMERDFAAFEQEMAATRAQVEAELAEQKTRLIAQGVDPATFNAKPAEVPLLVLLDQELERLRQTDPAAAARAELHRPWLAKAESELAALDGEMAQMQAKMDAARAEMEASQPRRWTREQVQEAAARGASLAGERLDGLDLSGLVLSRLDLRGASLKNTNLTGTKLTGANLVGADLSTANLTDASLQLAQLDDADLTGATVTRTKWLGACLRGATLPELDLAGADLTGCEADRVNFSNANLAGARFDRAALTQANFTMANLTGASFAGAVLHAAQCEGVRAEGAIFEGADITELHGSDGSNFQQANFRRVRGDGAIFNDSILDGADFSRSSLARAQFTDTSLNKARFDRAILRGAMFDDAVLVGAILTNADLLRASFDRANLTDADVRGSNCYEAGFWDALVERANFRNANLKGTLLSR